MNRAHIEQTLARMMDAAGVPHKAGYRPDEAARALGCSEGTVYRMMAEYPPGGLRWYRVGAHRRIPHPALVDWLADKMREGEEA